MAIKKFKIDTDYQKERATYWLFFVEFTEIRFLGLLLANVSCIAQLSILSFC